MYVIGITGGVGAGKSAVLSILSECVECEIIRADDVANRLKLKGQPCFQKIVDLLGEQILGSDGEIDRSLMSMIVFEDDAKMKQVEQILHPQVKRYITETIKQIQEEYQKDPVYSHVAKKLGVSPATVKRYTTELQQTAQKKENFKDKLNEIVSDHPIEIAPIEEVKAQMKNLPDFHSWTTLTKEERKALGLN